MASLAGKFERDVLYLKQNLIPLKNSGKEVVNLEYSGEQHEKLNDDDIARLSEALQANSTFTGALDLSGNDLSDLAALHLSKALAQKGAHHITKLNLSQNKFTTKTGEYIGQALLDNPDYPVY